MKTEDPDNTRVEIVEMMIGPRNLATLKAAEQFMRDVVSYYQVNDPANKLAGQSAKVASEANMEILADPSVWR